MSHSRWWVLAVVLAGCDTTIQAVEGGGGASGDGGQPSQTTTGMGGAGDDGGGGEVGCSVNEVPLELTILEGVADSQVVPILFDGIDGYLAIDTGSPLTFVFGKEGDPEYVPYVGDAQIGCETVAMAQVTLEAIGVEIFNGKPILGILGIDFLTDRPAEIDYPGGRVVRYVSEAPDTTGLVAVPSEFTGDRVIVASALDDVPLRLIYDAGSPHTLWVGVDGEPGDEPIQLGTADGNSVLVYEGTAELALGADVARTIPVWRTQMFPYIQEELDELASDGLLGASGMGFRRILFDSAGATVWLGEPTSP